MEPNSRISPNSISSVSIPTTLRLMARGRPRPSRRSTTRRCAISSSTCTVCSTPTPRPKRDDEIGCVMLSWKRLSQSRLVQRTLGNLVAEYLRLVWKTSSFVIEPADFYERIDPQQPIIVAMWHGQHFMVPFFKRKEHKVKVLISRHRDGEVNAIAAELLGVDTILGSGDHGRRYD